MFRKNEKINNDNFNNNQNFRYNYGKLRRKMKNTDLNDIKSDNYFSNNNLYNNYNNNYLNNQKNSNYLMKDSNKDIYTSYKHKNNDNNISNNYSNFENYNGNIEENNKLRNKDIKPILRSSKSAIPNKRNIHQNNYYNYNNESPPKENKDYLLCQNCINDRLIEEKRRKEELGKKSSIPQPFEDKYKNYNENKIREKVQQREKNIAEIYNNLEKWNQLNDKDRLIKENENSINPLYQDNHNYVYEKFQKKYERKQKLINDNYNKFQNLERPEITDYFRNYVNNPKYIGISYGEYKPKKYDVDGYRKVLDEQINYRNNKKREKKKKI